MRKIILTILAAMLLTANVEAKSIKVGKSLKKCAVVVSTPVRHPLATTKAVGLGSVTGFLAGVESVGMVLETVGLGVEKVGGLVYDLGEVLSGYNKPAPAPAPVPTPSKP